MGRGGEEGRTRVAGKGGGKGRKRGGLGSDSGTGQTGCGEERLERSSALQRRMEGQKFKSLLNRMRAQNQTMIHEIIVKINKIK